MSKILAIGSKIVSIVLKVLPILCRFIPKKVPNTGVAIVDVKSDQETKKITINLDVVIELGDEVDTTQVAKLVTNLSATDWVNVDTKLIFKNINKNN